VAEALEVAKSMALSINEDKRNKEELIAIQAKLVGWRGPPITATSTLLIHEGLLTKISGKKAQERHFYLFDNLLVYCKKTLKGHHVQGKLLINELTIESIEDGDEEHAGKPVNNAMRFYTSKKKKTYICYADSFETKEVWIDAFLKEREKVEHDLDAGIVSQVNIVDGSFEEQQRLRAKRKNAAKNCKIPKGIKSPKGVKKGMTTKRK